LSKDFSNERDSYVEILSIELSDWSYYFRLAFNTKEPKLRDYAYDFNNKAELLDEMINTGDRLVVVVLKTETESKFPIRKVISIDSIMKRNKLSNN